VLRPLALLLLAATAACSSKPDPVAALPTVPELGAAWSGGRTDPVCNNRGPRGEYLGPTPGAQHCQWPTPVRGAEFSTVSATRDSVLGWTTLTWERVFTDTSRVRILLDSLDGAFAELGVTPHRCAIGTRRWQAPGLVVQSAFPMPRPTGGVTLHIYAATIPVTIPSMLCPDAPPLNSQPIPRT
jgi:hypothetical protein